MSAWKRRVALKQLYRQAGASPEEAEVANRRAVREARPDRPTSTPARSVGVRCGLEQDGQLWLVMQFVPSITLAAVLQRAGPLQPEEAAKVGAQVASALAAAHAVGIVHRDVKPGNILIAEDGTALISDFGIARALGDVTLTSGGMIHGTPAYLAPEVARGADANFASDVFSLGSTLYSALEGQPTIRQRREHHGFAASRCVRTVRPPQRSGILTPVIMDMLSVNPEARPSMAAVAETLGQARSRSEQTLPIAGPPAPIGEDSDLTAKISPPTGSGVDFQQAPARSLNRTSGSVVFYQQPPIKISARASRGAVAALVPPWQCLCLSALNSAHSSARERP
jgi:serine/threonine protein kinase